MAKWRNDQSEASIVGTWPIRGYRLQGELIKQAWPFKGFLGLWISTNINMHLVLLIYQDMSQHPNILCLNTEKHKSQVIVKLTRMRLLNLKQDDPLLPFLAINSRMLQNLEGLYSLQFAWVGNFTHKPGQCLMSGSCRQLLTRFGWKLQWITAFELRQDLWHPLGSHSGASR